MQPAPGRRPANSNFAFAVPIVSSTLASCLVLAEDFVLVNLRLAPSLPLASEHTSPPTKTVTSDCLAIVEFGQSWIESAVWVSASALPADRRHYSYRRVAPQIQWVYRASLRVR